MSVTRSSAHLALTANRSSAGRALRSVSILWLGTLALLASSKTAAASPQLRIERTSARLTLPEGCVYGEEASIRFELCNVGTAAATGFRPGLAMGPGDVLSVFSDRPIAASPGLCGDHDGVEMGGCAPQEQCVEGSCVRSCSSSANCGEGQGCAAGQCVNVLAAAVAGGAPGCASYEATGRIPEFDRKGAPYAATRMRFFSVSDLQSDPAGGGPGSAPDVAVSATLDCEEALPDLVPVSMRLSTRIMAGDRLLVERQLRNQGLVEKPAPGAPAPADFEFEYGYFLAIDAEPTSRDLLLPLETEDGLGRARLGAKWDQLGVDRLRVPPSLPPGAYRIALILDPADRQREWDRSNNVLTYPKPLEIAAAPLEIVTASIPRMLVGSRPVLTMEARGGVGSYRWDASRLPPGLELSADGLLGGSPTEPGVQAARLRVRSGDLIAERALTFEVVAASGPLAIATAALPVAIPGRPYAGVALVAQGGKPPYRWSLDPSGPRPPEGIEGPDASGWIGGAATLYAKSATIVVRVEDTEGSAASRQLLLPVRGSQELELAGAFDDGEAGAPYHPSCLLARGGEAPYRWDIDRASLPAGLEAEIDGDELCLEGVPGACGDFAIRLMLRDEADAAVPASLPLGIACTHLRLLAPEAPALQRGEEVSMKLASEPEGASSFRLVEGRLPPGLRLEETGLITGTVESDATPGVYSATIELEDGAGGRGAGAIGLRVVGEPGVSKVDREGGGGCQSVGGGSWGWGLVGAWVFAALRRSRRSQAAVEERGSQGAARSVGLGILGAVVLLCVGGAGCGEEEVTIQRALCHEVSCGEGASCDPFDGQCKCGGEGGVFCKEDERCVEGPPASCESLRCDFVECAEGESCDPATGECSCGGARCEAEERCEAGRCVVIDPCNGVRCPPAMECSPDDGACTCQGARCAEGESCVEGACKLDLCAGVSCSANEICSDEDGVCHCGDPLGPICGGGERCVLEEAGGEEGAASCERSKLCDGVSCGPGMSCDPADGSCRCGGVGPGFPACGAAQRCIDGQCLGGGLCGTGGGDPVVCEGGLSCDPTTGACLCGGAGGRACAEGERCVGAVGGRICAAGCTLGSYDSCAEGEACTFDEREAQVPPTCRSEGAKVLNMPCDGPGDCAAGYHCGLARACRRLCFVEDGAMACASVSPHHACLEFQGVGVEGIGICVEG